MHDARLLPLSIHVSGLFIISSMTQNDMSRNVYPLPKNNFHHTIRGNLGKPMSVRWSKDECKHRLSLTSESKSDTTRLGPPPDLLAWGLSCWSSSLSQLRCRFLCKSETEGTERDIVSAEDSTVNMKVKKIVWWRQGGREGRGLRRV